ncbi:MAG: YceD family protein [Anaerotardibacter sp.]
MADCFIEVPDKLFATAESLSFKDTCEVGTISQGATEYVFAEPLTYDVFVTNTGGALLVSGTVFGVAKTQCARCLEETEFEIEGEVEGYFLLPGADVELTQEEEDEYEVLGEDKKIDLKSLLIAALSLEFPYVPLCSDDCKGLCPQCGANLNTETCVCGEKDDIDEMNPFAVLKNYKFSE